MIVNINEASKDLLELVKLLEEQKEEEIIITKDGKQVVSMKLFPKKTNKRIGTLKEEYKDIDMSLEEFDSYDVSDLF